MSDRDAQRLIRGGPVRTVRSDMANQAPIPEVTPAVERGVKAFMWADETGTAGETVTGILAAALDVEEMARAIYESALHNNAPGFPFWDEQTEHIREYWRVYARAARTALLGAVA